MRRSPVRHLPTLLAALAGAVIAVAPVAAAPATASPVRLQGAEYLGDLPTLLADVRGLFAEAGIEVSYGRSGKAALDRLRAGEIAFATMAMTPLVLDLLRDGDPGDADDPVVLANLAYSTEINHVVTLASGAGGPPLSTVPASVGLAAGTNAQFLWHLFAAHHGLAPGEVPVVDLPIDALPAALADGRVAAAVVWEPWTSRLRRRHGERLRVLDGSRLYTVRWLLVTRRAVVRERPELCHAVLDAYRAAVVRAEAEPAAARALFARRWEVPADVVAGIDALPIYDVTLDWTVFTSFRRQLAWARRAGEAGVETPASLFDLVAPACLRTVDADAVLLPRPVPVVAEGER